MSFKGIICGLLALLAGVLYGEGIEARFHTKPEKVFTGAEYDLILEIDVPAENELQDIGLQGIPFLANQSFESAPTTQHGDKRRMSFVARMHAEAPMIIRLEGMLTGRLVQQRQTLGLFKSWRSESARTPIQPFELRIRDLPPEGRPQNFSGAIGEFILSASVQPDKLRTGELATLQLSVNGIGNLSSVTNLRAEADSALFRVYPPKQVTAKPDKLELTQVVIPLTPQSTNLPAVAFSYFDTDTERYKTLSAGPFALTIDTSVATNSTEQVRVIHVNRTETTESTLDEKASDFVRRLNLQHGARSATVAKVATAHLAPSEQSLPLFTVTAGTTVQVLESADSQVRIDSNGRRGWIAANALQTTQGD